jgi:hypothetical protein
MASTATSTQHSCLNHWDAHIRLEHSTILYSRCAALTDTICKTFINGEFVLAVISGISMTCDTRTVYTVNSVDRDAHMKHAVKQEEEWRTLLRDPAHSVHHESIRFIFNALNSRKLMVRDLPKDDDEPLVDDDDCGLNMPDLESDNASIAKTVAMARAAAAAAEAAARSMSDSQSSARMDVDDSGAARNAAPVPPAANPDVKPPRTNTPARDSHAEFVRQQHDADDARKHAPRANKQQRQPPQPSEHRGVVAETNAQLAAMFERLSIVTDAKSTVSKTCRPDEHGKLTARQASAKAYIKSAIKDAKADLFSAALGGTDFVSTWYKYDQGSVAVECGTITWLTKDSSASHQLQVQAKREEIRVYAVRSELKTNTVPLLVVKLAAFERVCNGVGTGKSAKTIKTDDAYSGKIKIDNRITDVVALNCCSIPLISVSKAIQCHIERQVQSLLITYTSGRGPSSGSATHGSCDVGVDYDSS